MSYALIESQSIEDGSQVLMLKTCWWKVQKDYIQPIEIESTADKSVYTSQSNFSLWSGNDDKMTKAMCIDISISMYKITRANRHSMW